MRAELWKGTTWGALCLSPDQKFPDEWGAASHRRFDFICACGRATTTAFKNVSGGKSVTCGNCTAKSREYWCSQTWGRLHLDSSHPHHKEWSPGSQIKLRFICECNRSIMLPFKRVTSGHTKSCGKCDWNSKEFWLNQTWGSLKLDLKQELPEEWSPYTKSRFTFICVCGRYCNPLFANVTNGNSTTCGKCSECSKEYWLLQTWGELTLVDATLPTAWAPHSAKEFEFLCSCGRRVKSKFFWVFGGGSLSCGRCSCKSASFWLTQKWGRLKLDETQELPEEWSYGSDIRLTFVCDCGRDSTNNSFFDITAGKVNSCGCARIGRNEFSPETQVRQFVMTLTPDTYQSSYLLDNSRLEYDVYTPSNKLAIEHHGLFWHSDKFQKGCADFEKFKLACSRGDRLIQIYSDEWSDLNKQEIFKAQLRDIIAPEPKIRIKPAFSVETKTSPEVRAFLDAHHYLGAASGCVTIVARHREAIVGAWVFMKRETGVVLWHRACWDRKYKSWNPHEKALKMALPALREMGFTKMVTFSDNRFHTGNLYEKLGFTFEEEIAPEYSYTNGRERKSKYALRVPAGVNEVEEAAKKGWYRIYDSGKRRYSLQFKEECDFE